MRAFLWGLYRLGRVVFICVALVAPAGAFAYVTVPWPRSEADVEPVKSSAEEGEKIRREGSEGVIVPAGVAHKMGLRTAEAAEGDVIQAGLHPNPRSATRRIRSSPAGTVGSATINSGEEDGYIRSGAWRVAR